MCFLVGDEGLSVCCWGVACCCRWAEFLSLARQFICLVSDFVIGDRSFLGSVGGSCLTIGHIVCACLWYVSNMLITYFAALSMCVGVVVFKVLRSCM